MTSPVLLPDPSRMMLVTFEEDEPTKMITALAVTLALEAACPLCQQASGKVHSSYLRTLADLPCFGKPVRWYVQVRRMFCENTTCTRKIFTERLPSCAPAYARRTLRQTEALREIAFAVGGRPGERLVPLLGMSISHESLIRLIRRSPVPAVSTPENLGVDDFAWRKGQRYGTILVDLETHRVIDLLPDREGGTLLAWLRDHPGIKMVSRDRASAYAEAVRQGAPEAMQVADRFHLLVNLRDTVKRLLDRKRSSLPPKEGDEPVEPAVNRPELIESTPLPEKEAPLSGEQKTGEQANAEQHVTFSRNTTREKHYHTRVQESHHAGQAKRLVRFEEIRELHQQGIGSRAIARTLGICRATVRRYLDAEQVPEPSSHPRPHAPSKLDPFIPYLLKRWAEHCYNGTQLYREICAQGYTGSRSLVSLLIADIRKTLPPALQPGHRRTRTVDPGERPVAGKLHIQLLPGYQQLSPKSVSWLLVSSVEKLTEEQQAALKRVCQAVPEFQTAYELAQGFVHMVHERKAEQLSDWLDQAEQSGLKEFKGFAQGIRRDHAAVLAALSTAISNGQTEGQVNRLKLIKRQGYGRAKFDLLRLRVMHGSGRKDQQKCV